MLRRRRKGIKCGFYDARELSSCHVLGSFSVILVLNFLERKKRLFANDRSCFQAWLLEEQYAKGYIAASCINCDDSIDSLRNNPPPPPFFFFSSFFFRKILKEQSSETWGTVYRFMFQTIFRIPEEFNGV